MLCAQRTQKKKTRKKIGNQESTNRDRVVNRMETNEKKTQFHLIIFMIIYLSQEY